MILSKSSHSNEPFLVPQPSLADHGNFWSVSEETYDNFMAIPDLSNPLGLPEFYGLW
jgi:hypothetical protein